MSNTLNIKNLSNLIRDIKNDIQDHQYDIDDPDKIPYIQITIAANIKSIHAVNKKELPISHMDWDYQTGDNSFIGSCYRFNTWEVGYIYQDTNSRELARELINGLFDNFYHE